MSARDKLRALRETNAELLHACKLAVAWIDADRDVRNATISEVIVTLAAAIRRAEA